MSTAEGRVTAKALTATEATTFDDLEQVIEKGLARFVEVGNALETIRDRRLYREGFSSFEDYLQERWKISRSYAYRQIEAAQVAGIVSPIGDSPAPATESVARELGPLRDDPERAQQAWQEAVQEHGPDPTAAQVREVVKRRRKPAQAKPVKPTRQEIQRLASNVLERSRALERSIATLTAALAEGADINRDGPVAHADLARTRQALERMLLPLDEVIAKVAPDLADSDSEAEMARVTAKFE